MKFSVLLPTRNRLDLLKLAIESVRRQDYANWEVVVSDNASEDDVVGYVRSLGDERIRARRMAGLVPVTENWNASLEAASGDYFVMLGDDDALMPGALSEAAALLGQWRQPPVLYAQALQYAYPGVMPGHAEAFIRTGYNEFLEGRDAPFVLPREVAMRMVRAALSFRVRYGYNMQHFVFSRALVERLRDKGPFFQSPYPDYYAANAILLAADPVLVTPQPLTMIGISPKSFGYYYYNKREKEGVDFLRNVANDEIRRRLRSVMVPGTNMNDSWLCAMETLALNFGPRRDLRVNYNRYRLAQFAATLAARSWRSVPTVVRHARLRDVLLYGPASAVFVASFFVPRYGRRARRALWRKVSPYPTFDSRLKTVPYKNILEAADACAAGR